MATKTESNHANQSSKAREPEQSRHRYDDSMLDPKQFLLAVMHDRTAKLRDRMDAAVKLLRIAYIGGDYLRGEYPDNREPVLTYKIEGIKLQ
jgi:hypothetical protein